MSPSHALESALTELQTDATGHRPPPDAIKAATAIVLETLWDHGFVIERSSVLLAKRAGALVIAVLSGALIASAIN